MSRMDEALGQVSYKEEGRGEETEIKQGSDLKANSEGKLNTVPYKTKKCYHNISD